MKKFIGRIILFIAVLAVLLVISITANAQSTTVPFTAEVSGKVILPAPISVAAPAATTVKVPGLNAVREGVAELQEQFGYFDDKLDNTYGLLERIEAKQDQLLTMMASASKQPVRPFWWVLLGGIVGLLVGLLIGRSSGNAGHGSQVTGPLVQGPLVSCPGPGAAQTADTSGGKVPIATIPALPGTSYRVEQVPLAETTRRNVEEMVVSKETGEAIQAIIRAIGEAARKPEPPKPPAEAPPATPQA